MKLSLLRPDSVAESRFSCSLTVPVTCRAEMTGYFVQSNKSNTTVSKLVIYKLNDKGQSFIFMILFKWLETGNIRIWWKAVLQRKGEFTTCESWKFKVWLPDWVTILNYHFINFILFDQRKMHARNCTFKITGYVDTSTQAHKRTHALTHARTHTHTHTHSHFKELRWPEMQRNIMAPGLVTLLDIPFEIIIKN